MGSLVGLTGPRSSWLPGFSRVEAASNWLANLSHEVPDYRNLGDPGCLSTPFGPRVYENATLGKRVACGTLLYPTGKLS